MRGACWLHRQGQDVPIIQILLRLLPRHLATNALLLQRRLVVVHELRKLGLIHLHLEVLVQAQIVECVVVAELQRRLQQPLGVYVLLDFTWVYCPEDEVLLRRAIALDLGRYQLLGVGFDPLDQYLELLIAHSIAVVVFVLLFQS